MTRLSVIKRSFKYTCALFAPCGEAGLLSCSWTEPLLIKLTHPYGSRTSWALHYGGCLLPVQSCIPWIISGAISKEIFWRILLTSLWTRASPRFISTCKPSVRRVGCAKRGYFLRNFGSKNTVPICKISAHGCNPLNIRKKSTSCPIIYVYLLRHPLYNRKGTDRKLSTYRCARYISIPTAARYV